MILCSRRSRKAGEADFLANGGNRPPPHVGGYNFPDTL